MTLADFTSPGLILPSLRGHDAASVIHAFLKQCIQHDTGASFRRRCDERDRAAIGR